MKKILTTLVAAAAIGGTVLATASPANAWWRYGPGWGWGWRGWGWGAAAAGVAVGAAVATAPYRYGYYYPYGPYYPYYGPGCRRVWNGYAWVRACY